MQRQVGNAIPVSNRHLDERIEMRSDSDDRYRVCVVKQARPGFTKAKQNSRKDSVVCCAIVLAEYFCYGK